ncbi:DUF4112 domain-containing protein [Fulvimarina sp. 2208YS6-2-32]|uniref:DUF4112 domain-containing protein n=1 Tax=Fulvimarina uroteuthidis TaxID=3098149 RepID=A0ABU5I5V1_9HYPH|nr:DUF4112 domain-containing protein [Fulvimarina sp. 2208YS6-2-32]MDY8110747.1 DUF4112 domain-containing protein [Fulvimarina sp. 2208YS6-2-32]
MTTTDTLLEADRRRRLKRIGKVARLMDTAVRIPGTGIRFGGDAIVGLIPGIGDAGGGLISLWMINEARRLGMPNAKIVRMLANVGVDVGLGSIPLLGDAFDLYFKANRRNFDIIADHFGEHEMRDHVAEGREMKDITPKTPPRR